MKVTLPSFTKLLRRTQSGEMRPERDWLVLLGAALVLLLIILVWHVWAFETVVGGGSLGDTHPGAASSTNVSALDTVQTLLDTRAAQDANYINGTYRFTDPSI